MENIDFPVVFLENPGPQAPLVGGVFSIIACKNNAWGSDIPSKIIEKYNKKQQLEKRPWLQA